MIESNEINRESLQTVQRAFVTFRKVDGKRFANRSQPETYGTWRFWGVAANSGTTPARNVITHFDAGNVAQPSEDQFRGSPGDYVDSAGPRDEFNFGYLSRPDSFLGLDVQDRPHGVSPTHVTYWGWLVYKDLFYPKTKWHLTEFCTRLSGVSIKPPSDPHEGESYDMVFRSCRDYNCTDDDCKDYKAIVKFATETAARP